MGELGRGAKHLRRSSRSARRRVDGGRTVATRARRVCRRRFRKRRRYVPPRTWWDLGRRFFWKHPRVRGCARRRRGVHVARRLHRTARARPELERHELLRTPDLALRRGMSPLRRLVRPASPVQERRERGACARSAHRPTSGPWFVVQPLTRPSPDPPPQDDERYEKYLDSAVEVLKVVAMIGAAYFVYRAMDR